MRILRQLALAGALSFPAAPGLAQLVNDGATNIISATANTVTGDLTVGTNGSQTALILTNGGEVDVSGNTIIGANAGSFSNSVSVGGAGAVLATTGNLYVGSNGWGNQMLISAGGTVTDTIGYLGNASSNNIAVITGAGSVWSNTSDLNVGNNGSGNRVTVINGGKLFAAGFGDIGNGSSSGNNEVIVDGAGSVWTNLGTIYVGSAGSANRLTVTNGGRVRTSAAIEVGRAANSSNNVAVITGSGSIVSVGGSFRSGNSGSFNRVTVSGGGRVEDSTGYIGYIGSNNVAEITGTGTLWTNSGTLTVGDTGSFNLLVVSNGAGVVSLPGMIGAQSNAGNNTAIITGPGSLWSSRGDLYVGSNGIGNRLTITGGATVVNSNGQIGFASSSSNNVAVVTGGGSLWSNAFNLYVGNSGAGNQLIVSNGGVVQNYYGYLGGVSTSSNNVAVVTGTGSLWVNESVLYVGDSGAGNQLIVSNGGVVRNYYGYLGGLSTSSNNVAVVTGAGSQWNQCGLYVGGYGAGNQLIVSNGGVVRTDYGYLGGFLGSTNNVAVVTGAGSLWSNTLDLYVGGCVGNQLVVSNGGVVVDGAGYLGYYSSCDNNVAVVTGAGSLWSNANSLQVGGAGAGNQLSISNGGTVFASNAVYLGFYSTGNRLVTGGGTLRVTNNAGTGVFDLRGGTNVLNAGTNDVDQLVMTNAAGIFQFNGGTLLTRAGLVSNGAPFIVGASGSTPAIWDVRGGATNVTVASSLVIGRDVPNSQLLVTRNQSLTVTGNSTLGFSSSASNTLARVSGTGSIWSTRGSLFVGSNGSLNQLVITNGGVVAVTDYARLGFTSGSFGNLVSVYGPGSQWQVGSNLSVGYDGSGNRLRIINGASVSNVIGFIGLNGVSSNNVVEVNGSNSTWTSGGDLNVGFDGSGNTLLITNGGRVANSVNAEIGCRGTGNRVIVTGSNSAWNDSGGLTLGFMGLSNTLLISNGGTVTSTGGIIGYGPFGSGGNGNAVIVTGSKSVWSNSGSLNIGFSGGMFNSLDIVNGGSVFAAGVLVGGSGYPGNRLTVNGGTLSVTNAAGNAGLVIGVSTNDLNGGLIEADALRMQTSSGRLQFNGGILNVRTSAVANGTNFMVGDGISAATYRMTGASSNVHSFANGLVISSNATLAGKGTIIGSVTNFGTITPGLSAGAINLNNNLSLRSNANLSFEIGGLIATNEYDVLNVTSFVNLAGTLSLSLINNFYPASAAAFRVSNFASATGAFGNVTSGARLNTTDNLGSFLVTLSVTNLVVGNYVSPDSDGDGMTDYAEFLAGTDPADPASVLKIVLLAFNGAGQPVVRFPFVAGKNYRILYTDDLSSGVWSAVNSPTFTTPLAGFYEWTDDGTQTGGLNSAARFYRIGLQ